MPRPTTAVSVSDPFVRWSAAVEAGAGGWYAAASASARSLQRDPVMGSLAWSLEGSLLRQMGRHDAAAVRDGRALAVSGFGRGSPKDDDVDAIVDALVGLAADAIGLRRLDRADVLLTRAEDVLDGRAAHSRVTLRVGWVHAEVAMARGDAPGAASAAARAVELSRAVDSERHRIKSRLILCASRLVAGDTAGAAVDARAVRSDADALGLLPLAWAASSISEAVGETGASTAREGYEVAIRSRGGQFS